MTSLQVDYWKFEEQKRTDKANEGLRESELAETARHNAQNEALGWAQLSEAARHNRVTEGIQSSQAESSRMQAETAQLHERNWKAIQDEQIAIQKDSNEIAAERNRIMNMDTALGYLRLDWERIKFDPEMELKRRQLDQEDERIKMEKHDNMRKWADTILGGVQEGQRIGISKVDEARKWVDSLVGDVRQIAGIGRDFAGSWTALAGLLK